MILLRSPTGLISLLALVELPVKIPKKNHKKSLDAQSSNCVQEAKLPGGVKSYQPTSLLSNLLAIYRQRILFGASIHLLKITNKLPKP